MLRRAVLWGVGLPLMCIDRPLALAGGQHQFFNKLLAASRVSRHDSLIDSLYSLCDGRSIPKQNVVAVRV